MPRLLVYVTGDRIGDALLKLPVIRGMRDVFPEHEIIWLAGRRTSVFNDALKPLVAGVIDEVREKAGIGVGFHELFRRPPNVDFCDIIIDTEQKLRSTLVLRRIPHSVFVSRTANYRYSDRKPSAEDSPPSSARQRFEQLVNLAAGQPVTQRFDWSIPEPQYSLAESLLPPGPRYVGFAPGAGGQRKRWPLDRFIQAAQRQPASGRTPVFFLGPEEHDWEAPIRAAVPASRIPEIEAPPGARGPLLAMAIATQLEAAVANDSGIGHLLASAGIPVVTLFGHTAVSKFTDIGDHRVILNAQDFGGRGLVRIPLAAVTEALDELFVRRDTRVHL